MAKKKKQQKETQETKPVKKRGFFGALFHLIFKRDISNTSP